MAPEIPLKVRVDIRDIWDAKDSPLKTSVDSLAKTLGYKIVPQVVWHLVWEDLKDRFPDKSTFIPAIMRITISWYDRLLGRLDDENYSEWTEKLLEFLSGVSRGKEVTLQIEAHLGKISRPITMWRAKTNSFYLGIPNATPASSAALQSSFDRDFEKLMEHSAEDDDEWSDVMEESKPVTRSSIPSNTPARMARVPVVQSLPSSRERLPTLEAIARPDDLLTSTKPYILILEHKGNKLWVQCSHEPSLELLAAYLNKWGKRNPHQNMTPVLKVELNDSDYFIGVSDSLTIEPYMTHLARNAVLNPTVILAFIEGVLGYEMVYTNGSYWVYKSDTLLK